MIITSRGNYGRGNASNVCSHCGKTRHTIDTCYRKHNFSPHFKFKNQNADSKNDDRNHEGSKSEVQP